MYNFSTIPEAISAIQQGEMLIIVDDPSRENQGDLFFPASTVDTSKINVMIRDCRGLVCVPMSREFALRLELPLMVEPTANTEKHGCSFTLSVDAATVSAFGISASDRALTIQTIIDPLAQPSDLVRPGHVFPLLARDGGVLERAGHTEASVDLSRLAGMPACGVICEILNDEGEPATLSELKHFALGHKIRVISIADLSAYLQAHPIKHPQHQTIIPTAQSTLPTEFGPFDIHVYKSILDNREHVALVLNNTGNEPMLTRVHSKCFTGDTLSSQRCDCNAQLHQSMRMVQQQQRGIIVYLNQEGRGIGLGNKIKAYTLQDQGYDTVEANHLLGFPTDARDYVIAVEILKNLGIQSIDLMTNNPEKEEQIIAQGMVVRATVPIETQPNAINAAYLKTKKQKLGHRLTKI